MGTWQSKVVGMIQSSFHYHKKILFCKEIWDRLVEKYFPTVSLQAAAQVDSAGQVKNQEALPFKR